VEIRQLVASDAQTFRELRLLALREHPEAFIDSYETELDTPVEQVAKQIGASTPENFHLGAFVDGRLVGIAHFFRQEGTKLRHRAWIGGMYVTQERRGQGIGRALLERCIQHARSLPDLEDLVLWVILGNEQAKALYEAAGFEVFCVEPGAFKIDGRYYDAAGMLMKLH
jgi:GNAT superfamily N-acetyltransferase